MKLKIVISLLLGTLVSAGALYLAMRNVPFENLWEYLSTINYFWIVPSTAAVLVAFVLRTLRWQVILSTNHKVDFLTVFHPLMIGFSINCILPGRVGEIARPVILSQKEDLPVSTGLATVALERVLDAVTLIALMAVVLFKVQPDPDVTTHFAGFELSRSVLEKIATGTLQFCLVLIGGIILVSIHTVRRYIFIGLDFISRQFYFLGSGFQSFLIKVTLVIQKIITNISSGFALIKQPKLMLMCLVSSLIIWLLNGLSYYVFSLGCPGLELSFMEVMVILVIVAFSIALPSVPGFWGIWEAGGVFAMTLLGVGSDQAAGYTLANHAIQIIPVIVIGLISAWITGVDILKVSYQDKDQSDLTANTSGPAREVSNE